MFYNYVKCSPPQLTVNSIELHSTLQFNQQSLTLEYSKVNKYQSIVNSLQIQIKYLTRDFLRSESSFIEMKSRLLRQLKTSCNPETIFYLCDFLCSRHHTADSIVACQNSNSSLQSFHTAQSNSNLQDSQLVLTKLKSFTYQSLSDETIEKLFPIWKSNQEDSGPKKDVIRFIGASLETKMKSDLLNAASDRLIKTENRLEAVKLNIERIKQKFKETKKCANWEYDEGFTRTQTSDFENKMMLKSEDLYGLEYEVCDSSTIIYTTDEKICNTCLCVPF